MTITSSHSVTFSMNADITTGKCDAFFVCRHGHIHNRERDGDFFQERFLECECSHVDIVGHKRESEALEDVQFLCADCGAVVKVELIELKDMDI